MEELRVETRRDEQSRGQDRAELRAKPRAKSRAESQAKPSRTIRSAGDKAPAAPRAAGPHCETHTSGSGGSCVKRNYLSGAGERASFLVTPCEHRI